MTTRACSIAATHRPRGQCKAPHRTFSLWLMVTLLALSLTLPVEAEGGRRRWTVRRRVARRVGPHRVELLLYNRVPKSGSTTVQKYLDKLSRVHGYQAVHYTRPPYAVYDNINGTRVVQRHITIESTLALAEHLAGLTRRYKRSVVVDMHHPFLNFSVLGLKQPLYINTLREPVERIISHYFYSRQGPRPKRLIRETLAVHGNLSLTECMHVYKECGCVGNCLDRVNCTRSRCGDLFVQFNSQLMYFCTWGSPDCRVADKGAYVHAKGVLKSGYVAFGILERHDDTLELLAARLPQFFKGITRAKLRAFRQTKDKGATPVDVIEWLREANALDRRFYDYAVALFELKYQQAMRRRHRA